MKIWFFIRFGIIGVASAITYSVMNFLVPLYILLRENQVFAYAWVATSLVIVLGLIILKRQFDGLPSEPNKKPFDFHDFLSNPGKTLAETARRSSGSETSNPGKREGSGIGEASTTEGPLKMGQIVEGVIDKSHADAELTLNLELPTGTVLEVYGQKCKVTKGNLKIIPRKSKEQKLKDMFPQLRTRKRKA